MPAYEYVCKDCSKVFIVFLSIKEFEDKPKIKCSHCEGDNVQKKSLLVSLQKRAKNHGFMFSCGCS